MIPDEAEFAWAVGLFEGEGCFTVGWNRNSGKPWIRYAAAWMHLKMTDEEPVREFHRIVQVGTTKWVHSPSARRAGEKPQWAWQASNKQARELMERMWPYMCPRRQAQIDRVLSVCARPDKGQHAYIRDARHGTTS